jgi:hypothetical protein
MAGDEHYVTAMVMDQYRVLMACRCGCIVNSQAHLADYVFNAHLQGALDAARASV